MHIINIWKNWRSKSNKTSWIHLFFLGAFKKPCTKQIKYHRLLGKHVWIKEHRLSHHLPAFLTLISLIWVATFLAFISARRVSPQDTPRGASSAMGGGLGTGGTVDVTHPTARCISSDILPVVALRRADARVGDVRARAHNSWKRRGGKNKELVYNKVLDKEFSSILRLPHPWRIEKKRILDRVEPVYNYKECSFFSMRLVISIQIKVANSKAVEL